MPQGSIVAPVKLAIVVESDEVDEAGVGQPAKPVQLPGREPQLEV